MNLEEGTRAAIVMIRADLARIGLSAELDATSPDGDIGKFSLSGQVARVITHRDSTTMSAAALRIGVAPNPLPIGE